MAMKSTALGYTIVELMVTLAVAAILMGFAVPAFNDFLRQRSITAGANDFLLAVTYARSEAIRRGANVALRAAGADSDNEWGEGYDVVVVSDDTVLRTFEPLDDATLNAIGPGWHNDFELTFNSRGMLTPQPNGTGDFQLCSTVAGVNPGRLVRLSVVGRPDLEEFPCP